MSRTICAKLGISEEHRSHLIPFIQRYVSLFDGKTPDGNQLVDALRGVLSLYRSIMSSDLDWPGARCEPDTLMQTLSDFILVLVAGHESAAYLLGTILKESSPYGGVLQMIKRHDTILQSLINEALRFDAPVQLVSRVAIESYSAGSINIRSGDRVYLHLGAANRDPSTYDKPDQFRPERVAPPHLAFGAGISHCIATHFAVTQSIILLQAISAFSKSINIDYEGVALDSGLSGREYLTIPGTVVVA